MASPYFFDRPETMTGQAFRQQAESYAPEILMPYADALTGVKQAQVQGPGGVTYGRQLARMGAARNQIAAGLGSQLASLEINRELQEKAARDMQRSQEIAWKNQNALRGAAAAAKTGQALGSVPEDIISSIAQQDAAYRELHGIGLGEALKQQYQDARAAQGLDVSRHANLARGQEQEIRSALNQQGLLNVPPKLNPVELTKWHQRKMAAEREMRESLANRQEALLAAPTLPRQQQVYIGDVEGTPEEIAAIQDMVDQKRAYERQRMGGIEMEQIQRLLSSGNEMDYRAGMELLDKAEMAMEQEKLLAAEALRDQGGPLIAYRNLVGLSEEDRARMSYATEMRDLAEEALARGDIPLYEGYMEAAELKTDEQLAQEAAERARRIENLFEPQYNLGSMGELLRDRSRLFQFYPGVR